MGDSMTRLRSGRSSATAEINAQMRAADRAVTPNRRLVDDPYAALFVSNPRYALLRSTPRVALAGLRVFDRLLGGMLAEILLRSKYFDDVLAEQAENGIELAILIAAGYDSTVLRHRDAHRLQFIEIDHQATQQVKRAVMGRMGVPEKRVTFVPADLERDDIRDVLNAAGFHTPTAPCVIGMLGVSYYLTAGSFRSSLRSIGQICSPGSTLVFDYMDPSVIDGSTRYRGARRAARSVQRRGEPYVLGLSADGIAEAAAEAGFQVAESIRVTDLVQRYGGTHPYCRADDYMGVVRLARVGSDL